MMSRRRFVVGSGNVLVIYYTRRVSVRASLAALSVSQRVTPDFFE